MFYFVTITRGDTVFFVISPNGGKYELSQTRERNTYLWETAESAALDTRWQHLIQTGDRVDYNRTYRS